MEQTSLLNDTQNFDKSFSCDINHDFFESTKRIRGNKMTKEISKTKKKAFISKDSWYPSFF